MLTKEEVKHIANLARLQLTEIEIEKFTTQLQGFLKYIDILNEIKTDNVKETSQVTGLINVTREDNVTSKEYSDEVPSFLKSSPFPIERRQVKVPGVFE
ncbi:MAG: aspartyl/glutamyl-tRNA(Asn/Gln) amidotransferase subunit C, aspartyl-tRNA(Asn)/glutamyl-tRNA (Gln) amidotransferase subunit C [Candidatus Peregrinibacteria bacterium GW2011_GWF2_33_10]|nr:MAG: aspartyl/glutamyl-tRNA(Asn/Gln) amidotransferase subunit C, aspartyl-tRNA(Asn)/glutamyl-tRNA (Gln) amidotransferase subunit C [Candidatus Peregrinibacteria bacterium GW2011_GWF2_33_10]OGJ45986.1 MAG: hypothetical protein A2263_02720 [Candidatus Peregrinibacteria bacterium RIFOXYA2_FULL_33_21]OGJ46313.1 MAG: hypothetical protein A2272_03470 [Candidatus Peregrinibacteria bacterium RIFOXYA12_FULL_33_12]OGJ51680.1 MAG: hypothetical protein A2307_04635 [Candidatus Peregrinibacteria bacterium 